MKTTNQLLIAGILAVILLFLMAATVFAENSTNSVDLEIKRVALFKNGFGFFNTTAKLPKGEKSIVLNNFPTPTLGTFWISYPKDLKFQSIISKMIEIKKSTPISFIEDLLQANYDRPVKIYTNIKDSPLVEGRIVKFDKNNATSDFFLVKTEHGTVALYTETIEKIEFDTNDIVTSSERTYKEPNIELRLDKEAKNENINISYLSQGISWMPSYLIDLSDPKKSKIKLESDYCKRCG